MPRKITYKDVSVNLDKISEPVRSSNLRSSVGMDKFCGEYYYIEVEKLIPFKRQSRIIFHEEDIKSLASTIKQHGVIQPISVKKSDNSPDLFEVISGERRLIASKMAGLKKIPCIIIDKSLNADEIAIVENVQRKDLHPIELARGLKHLIDIFKWGGQLEIEKRIGIAQSRVSELLKILTLHEKIQKLAIEQNFNSLSNLLSLLKLSSDKEREDVILNKKRNTSSNPNSNFSVMRLFYKDSSLKVQNNAFKKLSQKQKSEIKEILLNLLKELS